MAALTKYALLGTIDKAVDEVDKILAGGCKNLALDFLSATFITVDGLEWLEELLLRAQSLGAKVEFINVTPSIYKVFKVAHISSLLESSGAPKPSGPVC